jgi:hypothetical protein
VRVPHRTDSPGNERTPNMEDANEPLRLCANSECGEMVPSGVFACDECWDTVFMFAHDLIADEAVMGARIAVNALAHRFRVLTTPSI